MKTTTATMTKIKKKHSLNSRAAAAMVLVRVFLKEDAVVLVEERLFAEVVCCWLVRVGWQLKEGRFNIKGAECRPFLYWTGDLLLVNEHRRQIPSIPSSSTVSIRAWCQCLREGGSLIGVVLPPPHSGRSCYCLDRRVIVHLLRVSELLMLTKLVVTDVPSN